MEGKKILHIGFDQLTQQNCIDTINDHFDVKENDFIIFSESKTLKYLDANQVKIIAFDSKEYWSLIQNAKQYKKIVIHFLMGVNVHFLNNIKLDQTVEVIWVFWGADGYALNRLFNLKLPLTKSQVTGNQKERNSLLQKTKQLIKKSLDSITILNTKFTNEKQLLLALSKATHCATHIRKDLELVQNKYPRLQHLKHINFFYADFDSYSGIKQQSSKINRSSELTILLGNSGAVSNNHLDLIHQLKRKFDNQIGKIICPFSYGGNPIYQNLVKKVGKEEFGDRFNMLTEVLNKYEYSSLLLNEIDIACFMHIRQQAFGNIFTLLMMGKSVFMHSQSTIFQEFQISGIKIMDIVEEEKLFNLNATEMETNKKTLLKKYSTDKMLAGYQELLN